MQFWPFFRKTALVAWAAPGSFVGLAVGMLALVGGGRARLRAGTLEFYGGWIGPLFALLPLQPLAMTLGHVIVGTCDEALRFAGPHERVHVRQYERWGPFFIPAYLLCSLGLWLAGRRAYVDNPFEREAYGEAP